MSGNDCSICGEGDWKDHKYCGIIEAIDSLTNAVERLGEKLDK